MAAMESQLLHTSQPRREQSETTGPGDESLCRCCSLSVLVSDKNRQGGGRSLLVRKHAASPGTEKRETFYRFLRHGQLGLVSHRPAMHAVPETDRREVCARAARAEVRGPWSFTRGALVRHPAVTASHDRRKEPEIECSRPTWLAWARAGGACRQQASSLRRVDACCPGACKVGAWASLESHLSLASTGAAGLDLPQQQLHVCDDAHSAGANHVRQRPHCF
ncbi:hypothetical protein Purlil1_14303 [Purpureocillium lilacinum]|uniref:Uncharacterized protein n=1 Tax=Purpureocillium lilacinum TaxID=33203 RepID=A0ABR0BBN3_PURLI|nr:hypothetical protein Purlil1_14303 [Purpureocillium lilacinum]